jgi:hypothetical protein
MNQQAAISATENQEKIWGYLMLLALPFVVVIIYLQGLTQQFNVVAFGDETTYHYPTILKLAEEFPRLNLLEIYTATGPFYHILLMLVGKVAGLEIFKLRLFNVLISYLAVIALFRFLRAHVRVPTREAFLFSLLFCLSPYFFGASFVLFTDNLAWLLCILTLDCIALFHQRRSLRYFGLACLLWAAACLTRQFYAWLALVGLFYLYRTDLDLKKKGIAIIFTLLSFVPFGLLVLHWKGLTVPHFADRHTSEIIFNLRSYGLVIALTGLYAPFVITNQCLELVKSGWKEIKYYLIPIGIGIVFLLLHPIKGTYPRDVGYFWRLDSYTPVILSTGALFWIFIPFGLIVYFKHAKSSKLTSAVFVYLVAFLLASTPSVEVYQRYSDPFVLILLFMISGGRKLRSRMDYLSLFSLMGIYLAYIYIRCFFEGLE